MFFSCKPKPTLLRSPSLPKLQLLMLKVVATTPAEALRRLLAVMAARDRSAGEEMLAAVVGPPTEPRRPKTKPRGALLTVQLARCEGRGRVTVHFCVVINIFWKLTPSVSVQDPALAPAQVTEGMLLRIMKRGNFYVSGASWAKFHARYPLVSFEEFWAGRVRVYELRNADTKRFFAEFQCDPVKHAKILADSALHRKIRWILDTDRPYSAPAGLRELKPEPVDEEPLSPHEFMYRRKGIFDESSS